MGSCVSCASSRRAARLRVLLRRVVSRIAVVRRPREARRDMARRDVAELLRRGDRRAAVQRAGYLIEEQSVLDSFDIIESCCELLIKKSKLLKDPRECLVELQQAAAGIAYSAAHRGELNVLQDARRAIGEIFGREFAAAAKEAREVDPELVEKLSRRSPSPEMMLAVTVDIAKENSIPLELPAKTRSAVRQRPSDRLYTGDAETPAARRAKPAAASTGRTQPAARRAKPPPVLDMPMVEQEAALKLRPQSKKATRAGEKKKSPEPPYRRGAPSARRGDDGSSGDAKFGDTSRVSLEKFQNF